MELYSSLTIKATLVPTRSHSGSQLRSATGNRIDFMEIIPASCLFVSLINLPANKMVAMHGK
jgi:hypothetical protein